MSRGESEGGRRGGAKGSSGENSTSDVDVKWIAQFWLHEDVVTIWRDPHLLALWPFDRLGGSGSGGSGEENRSQQQEHRDGLLGNHPWPTFDAIQVGIDLDHPPLEPFDGYMHSLHVAPRKDMEERANMTKVQRSQHGRAFVLLPPGAAELTTARAGPATSLLASVGESGSLTIVARLQIIREEERMAATTTRTSSSSSAAAASTSTSTSTHSTIEEAAYPLLTVSGQPDDPASGFSMSVMGGNAAAAMCIKNNHLVTLALTATYNAHTRTVTVNGHCAWFDGEFRGITSAPVYGTDHLTRTPTPVEFASWWRSTRITFGNAQQVGMSLMMVEAMAFDRVLSQSEIWEAGRNEGEQMMF